MPVFFQRKLFWGIRVWQLFAFLGMYIFFAFQYWLAIWYTTGGQQNFWKEAVVDYFLLKIPFTIPLWGLYFIVWKKRGLLFKIYMHLITGPVWIFCWFHGYRMIQDLRGEFYLRGNAIWWDIYIPGLVYFLQFAVFHVYDFYLQTQQQLLREQELMQTAYYSELNALKAQVQPHFLFNTLNSISASVPKEMEHTRELIAKLADTFRYSLRVSEQEFVTIEQELGFVKKTLELEQERYKTRLQVIFDIDEKVLHHTIPPMLLQPIIENALKHGITPSMAGGCITVAIRKEKQFIQFVVKDTGVGIPNLSNDGCVQEGIGLRNTALRLNKLYKQQVKIENNHPSGLIVSFAIPIRDE